VIILFQQHSRNYSLNLFFFPIPSEPNLNFLLGRSFKDRRWMELSQETGIKDVERFGSAIRKLVN
jgi:hypothetical protein